MLLFSQWNRCYSPGMTFKPCKNTQKNYLQRNFFNTKYNGYKLGKAKLDYWMPNISHKMRFVSSGDFTLCPMVRGSL